MSLLTRNLRTAFACASAGTFLLLLIPVDVKVRAGQTVDIRFLPVAYNLAHQELEAKGLVEDQDFVTSKCCPILPRLKYSLVVVLPL